MGVVRRTVNQVERVDFRLDEATLIVAYMERLAGAEGGWINLLPQTGDDDDRPTALGYLTLFGGGGRGFTMCTWIPASSERRGRVQASLGISHVTARRAVAQLTALGVPLPETWFVEQDHPRRGLVLRLPPDEAHDQVLAWALRATTALSPPRPISRWRADVHLPGVSRTAR